MAILKSHFVSVVTTNAKIVTLPFVAIVVLIGLIYYVGNRGFSEVTEGFDELEDAEMTESVLNQKLEFLRTIDPNVLEKSDKTAVSLPEKGSGFALFSQLRALSGEHSIEIVSIQMKGSSRITKVDKLSESPMTLDAKGELDNVISFLGGLGKVAPISVISSVTAEAEGGGEEVSVKIEIASFSAGFPTKLPALTEPIKDLTREQGITLSEIEFLKLPEITVLDPEPVSKDRTDPFN